MTKDEIPPRKYFTELAIGLFTQWFAALPADQLHADAKLTREQAASFDDCHIYLICRRPYFCFEEEAFEFNDRVCSGNVVYRESGVATRLPFIFTVSDPDIASIVVDAYPHRMLLGFDNEGTPYKYFPASSLSLRSDVRKMKLRSFEAVYVGQAYGDGSRTAFDRLQNHSTLQNIRAESGARRPDDEVWIFMFDYAPCQDFDVYGWHIEGRTHWRTRRAA